MDDFNVSNLNECRNEYCNLFISKITPFIMQGIQSIFKEAYKLCYDNDEEEKYLMTFQNFLGRVTKWNQEIIEKETERIINQSGCSYLDDLLTCVHITELKILTSMRVGEKQKKIDLDLPRLNNFIHQVYIEVARRVYKNVYLFDMTITPLQKQKCMREFELFVKESILTIIRNNMPVEKILTAYLDETLEENVEEKREDVEEKEEIIDSTDEENNEKNDNKTIEETKTQETETETETKDKNNINIETNTTIKDETFKNDETNVIQNENEINKEELNINTEQQENTRKDQTPNIQDTQDNITENTIIEDEDIKKIGFNDTDKVIDYDKQEKPDEIKPDKAHDINVSKDIENLEKISDEKWKQRMEEEESDDEEEPEKLTILDKEPNINLNELGIETLDEPSQNTTNNSSIELKNNNLLDDDIIVLK